MSIGERLLPPDLAGDQLLVALAGRCSDVRHRLTPVCDDLLPDFVVLPPSRARVVAQAAVVVSGVVLAGGASYGVLPGELGHNGAQVVDAPATHEKSAAEVLADAYMPAQRAVGGASASEIDGTEANVVYVDGGTQSDGPSIVSTAFPAPKVSVLATRGTDGTCTFLRGDDQGTKIATTAAGAPCSANAAPRRGWSFSGSYGPTSK
jgi:hypothetical protein